MSHNKAPLFAAVFAEQWDDLPPALKAHYANRPFSRDRVVVEGTLNVTVAPLLRLFAPLARAFKMMPLKSAQNLKVEVVFDSHPDNEHFYFTRTFFYPNRTEVFRSFMKMTAPHETIEVMGPNIFWRSSYYYNRHLGGRYRVNLRHKAYGVYAFGKAINLPEWLEIFVGRGMAWEEETGPDSFKMRMEINHFLCESPPYVYEGEFKIKTVTLND